MTIQFTLNGLMQPVVEALNNGEDIVIWQDVNRIYDFEFVLDESTKRIVDSLVNTLDEATVEMVVRSAFKTNTDGIHIARNGNEFVTHFARATKSVLKPAPTVQANPILVIYELGDFDPWYLLVAGDNPYAPYLLQAHQLVINVNDKDYPDDVKDAVVAFVEDENAVKAAKDAYITAIEKPKNYLTRPLQAVIYTAWA